jgi:TolB-like protein
MRKTLVATVLFVICAGFSYSQQGRPVLGVLPFTGGAGEDGDVIASLFLNQRELRNVYIVVPRNLALNSIFTEQKFQMSDLADPNTVASITRMLNADYVLSGSITKLGDRNLLIASIIHVESFEQVAGYYRTYRNIEDVIGFLPEMSSGLVSATNISLRRTSRPPGLAFAPFTFRAGVSAHDAETLAQILSIEMIKSGRYAVLPRLSIIQAALREQGFQLLGHTDDAGWASLGRAMNANFVLNGQVSSLGAANLFMAQILNVEDGRVLEGDSVQYRAVADGINLMAELAILLTYNPGTERDRRLLELQVGQGRPVPVPGATLVNQLSWLQTNAANNANYIIEINSNITIAPHALRPPSGRSNVTVTLSGGEEMRTVSLSANGSLFTVESSITLILDNNITLQGRSDNNNWLVVINNGGTLVMNTGSWIRSNVGGGVNINNGGTFTMHGGTISDNRGINGSNGNAGGTGDAGRKGRSQSRGDYGGSGGSGSGGGGGNNGGVRNAGTFTMHGGTNSNNNGGAGGTGGAGGSGGTGGEGGLAGMHYQSSGGNGGTGGRGGNGGNGGNGGGGGVLNIRGGTFTMHGGTISNNNGGAGGSAGRGGNGGSGGSAGSSFPGGGGMGNRGEGGSAGTGGTGGTGGEGGVDNYGTFNMLGGTITSNRAGNGGSGWGAGNNGCGGVGNLGTFRISNGIIRGNAGGSLRLYTGENVSAQRGTFNAAGIFTQTGTLSTTDNTLQVENGALR